MTMLEQVQQKVVKVGDTNKKQLEQHFATKAINW